MNKPIPKDIKEQIIGRVREGKETVVEIARQHGVKVNTVYNWVSRDIHGYGFGSPILELAKLKRENTSLKQIIGALVLQMERGKKDRHG